MSNSAQAASGVDRSWPDLGYDSARFRLAQPDFCYDLGDVGHIGASWPELARIWAVLPSPLKDVLGDVGHIGAGFETILALAFEQMWLERTKFAPASNISGRSSKLAWIQR